MAVGGMDASAKANFEFGGLHVMESNSSIYLMACCGERFCGRRWTGTAPYVDRRR